MLAFPLTALGQEQPGIVAKYEKNARVGNFFTRWYHDLIGSSLVYKTQLTLYTDATYKYTYTGSDCGTFDENTTGTWQLKDTVLLLDENQKYKIHAGKLYLPETENLTKQNWAFKKVK